MTFCRACGQEIHETAANCPNCDAPQQRVVPGFIRSQTVALLLAALLGSLGIHRFYLGKPVSGVLYLLFSWTGVPGVVAIVEVFFMIFMSQETWARKYNLGVLSKPVPLLIRILALIIPLILITGLFSYFAMPVFEIYRNTPRGNWI